MFRRVSVCAVHMIMRPGGIATWREVQFNRIKSGCSIENMEPSTRGGHAQRRSVSECVAVGDPHFMVHPVSFMVKPVF